VRADATTLTVAVGFAAYRQSRWADEAVRLAGADEPDALSANQRNSEVSLRVSGSWQGAGNDLSSVAGDGRSA